MIPSLLALPIVQTTCSLLCCSIVKFKYKYNVYKNIAKTMVYNGHNLQLTIKDELHEFVIQTYSLMLEYWSLVAAIEYSVDVVWKILLKDAQNTVTSS